MAELILLDVAPNPVGIGALLAVFLLVVGFIVLLAVGLVLFLWYRKRSMRNVVMAAPALPVASADQVPSNPNQP
jgi:flagellar basal body-associated protein FliL